MNIGDAFAQPETLDSTDRYKFKALDRMPVFCNTFTTEGKQVAKYDETLGQVELIFPFR